MRNLTLAVVLAVGLGGDFGDATAETLAIDESSMVISVEVEVQVSADSVVAHLSSPGNEPLTIPLLDRGDGIFGIQTEVSIIDYQVRFEILGPNPSMSDPVSLSSMGVEFGGASPPTTTAADDERLSPNARRWGWLALALAAASLAALAVWVVVGRDGAEAGDGDMPPSVSDDDVGDSGVDQIEDQAGNPD